MNRTEPVRVTVLRHGAVAGRAHVFRGTLDEPLDRHSRVQMRQALERCGAYGFDSVVTSPLQRCQAFAAEYAHQHGVPLQVLPPFAEFSFGAWEGLTPDEASARHPTEYQAFRATYGEQPPPGGEALTPFRRRVASGWHEWLAQDAGSERLLVTHAGVMRALLMELFGFTPAQAFQIALPEAACMRISWLHGQPPFLLSIN